MKAISLHAANPGPYTGDGNWTYVIAGPQPVMIDAGVGHASHLDAIAQAVPAGLAHVVVTHAHSDHMSGVPAIRRRWPRVRFSKCPWPGHDLDIPWLTIGDGSLITTGEGDLQVLHTPGHSPDHVTLWHPHSKTIFVGDMMQAGSSVFIPASKGGNLADYLQSLRRMRALEPARALPAHGPAIDDPMGLIDHYLAHRRERELQVLAALAAGLATIDAITMRIYTNISGQMLPLARESVLAHLQKLEHDGRARRNGDDWQIAG